MPSLNKVQLIGNVGKEPETKYTPSGVKIIKFSIATNKNYKENEEWKTKTDWHNITAFGKLCELINAKKGDVVYIEGELSNNEYTDQNGVKHYSYNVIANVYKNLSPKEKQEDNKQDDELPEV